MANPNYEWVPRFLDVTSARGAVAPLSFGKVRPEVMSLVCYSTKAICTRVAMWLTLSSFCW